MAIKGTQDFTTLVLKNSASRERLTMNYKNSVGSFIMGALLGAICLTANAAGPGNGYTDWLPYSSQSAPWNSTSWVDVYYAVRIDKDEIRVKWKCHNRSNETLACSIGAGKNKRYDCYSYSNKIGTTESLGERTSLSPGREKVFESDWACRGLGASRVSPAVSINIER